MNTKKWAKPIRMITLAPIMAWVALTILWGCKEGVFTSLWQYIWAVGFLVVLPILAYPLQPILPAYKDKGREGQRQLAIVMAVLGYIGGIAVALIGDIPNKLKIVYFVYFISGVLILIFNKLLKVRASGHACGVAGPVAYLVYFLGPWALIGIVVLAIVYWASLKMDRHTVSQLVWGTGIPVVALAISCMLYG